MKKVRRADIAIFLLALLMTVVTIQGYSRSPILVSWALIAMILMRIYLRHTTDAS